MPVAVGRLVVCESGVDSQLTFCGRSVSYPRSAVGSGKWRVRRDAFLYSMQLMLNREGNQLGDICVWVGCLVLVTGAAKQFKILRVAIH